MGLFCGWKGGWMSPKPTASRLLSSTVSHRCAIGPQPRNQSDISRFMVYLLFYSFRIRVLVHSALLWHITGNMCTSVHSHNWECYLRRKHHKHVLSSRVALVMQVLITSAASPPAGGQGFANGQDPESVDANGVENVVKRAQDCLLYTSPSPRD